jgi:hypothetical protein
MRRYKVLWCAECAGEEIVEARSPLEASTKAVFASMAKIAAKNKELLIKSVENMKTGEIVFNDPDLDNWEPMPPVLR